VERRSRRRKRFSRGGELAAVGLDAPDLGAPELWTFSAQPGLGSIDLLGWSVEATDGPIGQVERATYEWRRSYLVVRAPRGRRVLLPAGLVERLDRDSETVFLASTRDAIERAPDHDERQHGLDDAERAAVSHYYSHIASR